MKFATAFAMPTRDTFDCRPIGEFVARYVSASSRSVDPFARNSAVASVTNDLNPNTRAQHHLHAAEFLRLMADRGEQFDLAIIDPPYSPRQISECYHESGLPCGMADTQNAALYSSVRAALVPVLAPGAIVLSFGWNSIGMGKKYAAERIELLLVQHGGAHNDTICVAERLFA